MSEDTAEEILNVLQRGPRDFVLPPDFLQPRLHMISLDFPQPFSLASRLQIVRPELGVPPVVDGRFCCFANGR
jgi:hypothetical protein